MVQEKGYEKVMEICRSSNFGQILFFANGQEEIIDAVEELNKILPSGVIALPYFAQLNPTYKNMVEKIDKQIKYVRNNKENVYAPEYWRYIMLLYRNIPQFIFKLFLIFKR